MSIHNQPILISDPKIIGPGVWFAIHTMSMSCSDRESCSFFIQFVKTIVETFPCDNCRKHGKLFIDKNPLEDYVYITNNIGEHIGMFKWTWEFHNAANSAIGKQKISFEDAWKLYSSTKSVCTGNCGGDTSNPPQLHQLQPQPQSQHQSQHHFSYQPHQFQQTHQPHQPHQTHQPHQFQQRRQQYQSSNMGSSTGNRLMSGVYAATNQHQNTQSGFSHGP